MVGRASLATASPFAVIFAGAAVVAYFYIAERQQDADRAQQAFFEASYWGIGFMTEVFNIALRSASHADTSLGCAIYCSLVFVRAELQPTAGLYAGGAVLPRAKVLGVASALTAKIALGTAPDVTSIQWLPLLYHKQREIAENA